MTGGWGNGDEQRRRSPGRSANTAEFFLTVTISATFIAALGWAAFTVATVGLLIGGVIAAPLGAIAAKRAPAKLLLVVVGAVLTATSFYGIYRALI